MIANAASPPVPLELAGLDPTPEERWRGLRTFAGPTPTDLDAMRATVDALFRAGPELVAGTYDYLLHTPETAAVLGWEQGADPVHLEERRRFFTIWLAHVLALNLSDDLARYLFRAGQMHAGHGPRRIVVPDVHVTGSIGLVVGSFARTIGGAVPDPATAARAVAGWNKLLLMHLDLMLYGATVARALDTGGVAVPVRFFGRVRDQAGTHGLTVHLAPEETLAALLRKLFHYLPAVRVDALERRWVDASRPGHTWMEVAPLATARRGWRVLLNGRDATFAGGLAVPVHPGDRVDLFPPGR
jgi:molybdopterin converting factor small subunit